MPCYRRRGTEASRTLCMSLFVLFVAGSIIGISYLAFGKSHHTVDHSTLRLVSILFRHGDKNPTETYPLDPYNNINIWQGGWGALTTKGKEELYHLGEFLRERYDGFIDKIYSPNEIYVTSSDHDRCVMSAQLLLAGLYPPTDWQIWNNHLLWQPIPVHTVPRDLDQLIVVKKSCPRYEKELEKVRNSLEMVDFNVAHRDLYITLTHNTGQKVNDILGVELLYNTLEIEDKNRMNLPGWTKQIYPEPMRELAVKSMALFTDNAIMKRLKGGPLLKDMVDHMVEKSLHSLKPDRKAFLYSGHDITIISYLRTLGFNKTMKPDPGAVVFLELHQPSDGSGHYVQLFYKNSADSVEAPELWEIPGCTSPCQLTSFITMTRDKVPNNWDEECQ